MAHVPLAVIGAGPAGLSCAIAARELGLDVTLIEALAPGGEMASLLEINGNLGSLDPVTGPDLSAVLLDRAMDAGVKIDYSEVASLARSDRGTWLIDGARLEADAVVIATGSEADFAAVAGAQELYGSGVSICASCDAPLFKNKGVIVLGDGRDAVYEVQVLRQYASRVTAVGDWSGADGEFWRLTAPAGDSVDFVQASGSFSVSKTADGAVDVAHRAGAPDVSADGVFLAVPRVPRRSLLEGLVDDTAAFEVDGELRVVTSDPSTRNLFAIGDMRAGTSRTVAGAIGDGIGVAWTVSRELQVRAGAL
ncbi:MAG: trxB [Microbacteriaceae bacterium]|jgi:thioredoxin reductase (NADPH)|nr:trxB [Microbacteriaceae bacterium]